MHKMKDEYKTKKRLVNELAELRRRIAELGASETERKRAEEGTNSYIVKLIDFWDIADIVAKIEEYWLTVAKLPPHEEV